MVVWATLGFLTLKQRYLVWQTICQKSSQSNDLSLDHLHTYSSMCLWAHLFWPPKSSLVVQQQLLSFLFKNCQNKTTLEAKQQKGFSARPVFSQHAAAAVLCRAMRDVTAHRIVWGQDSTGEVRWPAEIALRDCLRLRRWNMAQCGSQSKPPSLICPGFLNSTASWFAPNQSRLACVQWRWPGSHEQTSNGTKLPSTHLWRCKKPQMRSASVENRECRCASYRQGQEHTLQKLTGSRDLSMISLR